VVKAAQRALETRNAALVLIWAPRGHFEESEAPSKHH
jgi:hypothetical protein